MTSSNAHMRPRVAATVAALLAASVVLLALVAATTQLARAQTAERIHEYHVTINVTDEGQLEIIEVIDYDFGSNERRGILRNIPFRFHYDDRYDRVYPLTILDISTSAGAPDRYAIEPAGSVTTVRIGDPDIYITGRHTYTIAYRIEGALNGFPDHDELYWNAIGTDWNVPIDHATVVVNAPDQVTETRCFVGYSGSQLSCDQEFARVDQAAFAHSGLRAYEGFSIVVAFPTDAVPTPAPILSERWSLTRALTISPATVGATALIAILVLGVVLRTVWLAGRDKRWAGSAVDMVFGSDSGEVERIPLFEGGPIPVEYAPPHGLRPGLIGTLRDEVAHPLDVTATIIDLACRGYLTIEELEATSRWAKSDWQLTRLKKDLSALEAYEVLLMDSLFKDGDEMKLSDLRTRFAARLQAIQAQLYQSMLDHGWYRKSPAKTRATWLAIGIGGLIAGIGIFIAALSWTHAAIVPIPLIFGGILIIATHNTTPSRTPQGSAMLRRIRGFERFIATAEIHRSRFAEDARIFYDYLPYAIVFGLTDQWARAFEGLSALEQNPGWYNSSAPFAVGAFSQSMSSFAVSSAGAVAATPASSGSSGFGGGGSSGGGGGGGGGRSW